MIQTIQFNTVSRPRYTHETSIDTHPQTARSTELALFRYFSVTSPFSLFAVILPVEQYPTPAQSISLSAVDILFIFYTVPLPGTPMSIFLRIPAELRFLIYNSYLSEHRHISDNRQPSNEHIRILLTCRQIASEAYSIFRHYVSLLSETQIRIILERPHSFPFAHITWADVANDGRVLHLSSHPQVSYPSTFTPSSPHPLPGHSPSIAAPPRFTETDVFNPLASL